MTDATRRRIVQGIALGAAALQSGCGDRRPRIEDISALDPVPTAGIVAPRTTLALQAHLARDGRACSIGGGHYSMGDQVADDDALHLDMRGMARMVHLDTQARRVRVQAGMTWRTLQDWLDPHDLSVAVMQSYSNFTVGGSVSVNCHGRYVGAGPIANTVRALQLVTAEGRVLELTRGSEVFGAVIGGYGGLGVVTEVELDLADNAALERRVERVALSDYPAFFRERVLGDPDVVLHNADMAPPAFDAPLAVSWRRTHAPLTDARRLVPRDADYGHDRALIWAASELPRGERVRDRFLTDKLLHEPMVAMRNLQASLDARSLEPASRWFTTYLLQEYFVPVPAFAAFAKEFARILHGADANVLNVSIRHAPAESVSLLRWAPTDVFSFVLYHKQRSTQGADDDAGRWTRRLIDAALAHGGRHYLPYRLHATREQFERAYPAAAAYRAIKQRIDPGRRFRSRFLDKYL